MIRPESLEFPALNCSTAPELGDYYQEFRPAITLVEAGYFGDLDADGVPLVRYEGQGLHHNAITTAQYALANLASAARGDLRRSDTARAQLDALVRTQQSDGPWTGCWMMSHDNPKYPWLRAPWTSALASGNAISALLRGWQQLGEELYREAAERAYVGLHSNRDPALPKLVDEVDGDLWYEEYPAEAPLRVLNGHVYALLGVVDFARALGDNEAERRWRTAAVTVERHLRQYDLGYWSAYDLRQREITSVHYHKNIHIPQLRILAALTGSEAFATTADRWAKQLRSPVARARRAIGLRVRARMKKR